MSAAPSPPISRDEALRCWAHIATHSFGGPAGQIAVMHRAIVVERRWLSESRFMHALSYCTLLPGPEAMQLVTYLGWLLHGVRGGLVAGGLFVLPGFLSIFALSVLYVSLGSVPAVAGLFFGLKAAVLALVVEAMIRIGRRVLKTPTLVGLAAVAAVGMWAWQAPFVGVVVCAGLLGLALGRLAPGQVLVEPTKEAAAAEGPTPPIDAWIQSGGAPHTRPDLRRAALTAAVWLVIWLAPLAVVGFSLGWDHTLAEVGVMFSKAATVTFGGAYAVLALVAQEAVEVKGWLTAGQMLDGLGLAETTPGPLIQVVQHVGFMAGYGHPEGLSPWVAGSLGALLTTHVTFAPCFLWIFTGAPWVEAARGVVALRAALTAVTAAVCGGVLQLAVWLATHTLFAEVRRVEGPFGLSAELPSLGSVDGIALGLALGSGLALASHRLSLTTVLALAAIGGLVSRL
ncbi:chromate efflux transporter [Myxococcota bacterium]|nr:chromate efflux transporter [Myxococcota bacterium]